MKKRNLIIAFGIVFLIIVNSLFFIKAAEVSYNFCCEKTKNNAWCQNAPEEQCDVSVNPITKSSYRATPTSCDSTSYCKLGCCVNTAEGLCMENSPQKVCEISEGTWVEDAKCNVPQCTLGCCIIGDQASFVTLTRCKKLSSLYGLKTNFQKDIKDESQCIMTAYSQDRGACVYEIEGQKTCRLITRQECLDSNKTSGNISKTEFFKDYLCTADELGTNCGMTTETTCISGRDEVYFVDTCGNPANIYDSKKAKDPAYWKKIVLKSASCGYNAAGANKNSKTCGNCNYITGSICGKGRASYGDSICRDLNCYNTENGNNYKNGESWCETQGESGNGQDPAGSRYFRHVCVQGEETIEPCADFRNEICIEEDLSSSYGNFKEAACRVNRWNDCVDQFTEEDCLNTDKRDCYWSANGYAYDGSGNKNSNTSSSEKADAGNGTAYGIISGNGICLPNYPPGLKFWEAGDAKSVCSIGNSKQLINYSQNILGTKSCSGNCKALTSQWANDLIQICSSLGDCGAKSNFIGVSTDNGFVWKVDGKKKLIDGMMGDIKDNAK